MRDFTDKSSSMRFFFYLGKACIANNAGWVLESNTALGTLLFMYTLSL